MGKVYAAIDDQLAAFITAQHMFFVATAPADGGGHINISPKGLDALRLLDPHTVAYLDLVGSGIETIAHLRQNGRITLMFCAFDDAPKIVRLHGRGEVIEPGEDRFTSLRGQFAPADGARAIIRITLERISDSCGYGVPLFRYEGERSQLTEWIARKGPDGIRRYQREKNARSIDGLPGLPSVEDESRTP